MGKRSRELIEQKAKLTPEEVAKEEERIENNVKVVKIFMVLAIIAFLIIYFVYGTNGTPIPDTVSNMHFELFGIRL